MVSLFEVRFRSFTHIHFLLQKLFWNFSGNHTVSHNETILGHLPKWNSIGELMHPRGTTEEQGLITVLLSMGICSAEWTMQAEDKNGIAGGFSEAACTGVGIDD